MVMVHVIYHIIYIIKAREFPGSPVVRSLSFHCPGGVGSIPGRGTKDPTSYGAQPKK